MRPQKSTRLGTGFWGGIFVVLAIFGLWCTACKQPTDSSATSSTYTVTFMDGSTKLSDIKVESGKTVSRPSNPIKTGSTFDNWYSNSEFTILFDFSRPIMGNTTVYAQFNINIYTVTFNLDGGPPPPPPQNIAHGGKVTEPVILDNTGHAFSGWYREPTYTSAWNFTTDTVTGDIVLYARFSLKTYTVTFMDGGIVLSDLTQGNIAYGETVNRPADNPIKQGYTFDNWYSNSELTTLFNFSTPITTNTTIYAKFNINTYTVSFNADGGIPAPAQQNINHGGKVTQPPAMTKIGYGFGGWYKNAALTNIWNFTTDTVTSDTLLYAKWDMNFHTVTFHADGGLPAPEPQNIAYGSKVPQPVAMTKTGYTFGGWYEEVAFTNLWDFNTDIVTRDTPLYAKWTLNTYTVTFMDGSTELSALTQNNVPHGSIISRPANDPTKNGYTFDNWYSNSGLTILFSFDTLITENTFVYAKFNINTYTVTFNADGGTPAPGTQEITYNDTVTQPPAMTKDGYTFAGWYKEADFINLWNFGTDVVVTDTIIYAKWIIIPVTGITGVSAVMTVGTPLTLTGTVQPANAAYKTIVWSIKNAGTTSATLSGNTLNATTAGTVTVTATVNNGITIGTPYTEDFDITVRKSSENFTITFAQISDAASNLVVDQTISLSGTNGSKTVTLTVDNPGQYSSIEWLIAGAYVGGSGASFTLDSANTAYNSIGDHFLTVEVWKDGKPYNKTITFTVVP
jgi:uncharacterized repeat protein (TIGR02543 family)